MDIGEKIKSLRQKHGLTLEAVGEHVGVGKSTVRKWENGDIKNMRRDKIALLADALGVTPGYLMGWEADEGGDNNVTIDMNSIEFALSGVIHELSEDGKQDVLDFARFIKAKETKHDDQTAIRDC